jgi:hypothetical protein
MLTQGERYWSCDFARRLWLDKVLSRGSHPQRHCLALQILSDDVINKHQLSGLAPVLPCDFTRCYASFPLFPVVASQQKPPTAQSLISTAAAVLDLIKSTHLAETEEEEDKKDWCLGYPRQTQSVLCSHGLPPHLSWSNSPTCVCVYCVRVYLCIWFPTPSVCICYMCLLLNVCVCTCMFPLPPPRLFPAPLSLSLPTHVPTSHILIPSQVHLSCFLSFCALLVLSSPLLCTVKPENFVLLLQQSSHQSYMRAKISCMSLDFEHTREVFVSPDKEQCAQYQG